jgi:hypothetical protein
MTACAVTGINLRLQVIQDAHVGEATESADCLGPHCCLQKAGDVIFLCLKKNVFISIVYPQHASRSSFHTREQGSGTTEAVTWGEMSPVV